MRRCSRATPRQADRGGLKSGYWLIAHGPDTPQALVGPLLPASGAPAPSTTLFPREEASPCPRDESWAASGLGQFAQKFLDGRVELARENRDVGERGVADARADADLDRAARTVEADRRQCIAAEGEAPGAFRPEEFARQAQYPTRGQAGLRTVPGRLKIGGRAGLGRPARPSNSRGGRAYPLPIGMPDRHSLRANCA